MRSFVRSLRRSRPKEMGQAMVLISAGTVVLLAAAGLAIDVGSFRNVRERMQTAADSAAIAGVQALNNDNWEKAAENDAALNGFSSDKNGVEVNVYHPPSSGAYANNVNYVQVVISQPQPTYFMRVLGVNKVNVSVNSVAHIGSGPNCVYVLDPNSDASLGEMTASGGATVKASCGIIVDSASSTALTASGGGTSVKASQIAIVGGWSTNSGAVISPIPRTGIIPGDDPLSYVPEPSQGTCLKQGNYHVTGGTLYPGTYCGGMTINAGAVTTMNPGVYFIDGGGLTINGGANVRGSGVTIYNSFDGNHRYQGISIDGSAIVALSAPTSGPLEAMLFFQDRSVPQGSPGSSIGGGAAQSYEGALYFPTTSLSYSGGSSTAAKYTIIVADMLTISGGVTLNDDYSSLADGSPIKAATLAE